MNDDIEFKVDGTPYLVPISTYKEQAQFIELPNGQCYKIDGWSLSWPPKVRLTACEKQPDAVKATPKQWGK